VQNGTILNPPQNGSSVQILWNTSGTLGRVKAICSDRSEVASLQRVYNVNLTPVNVSEYETAVGLQLFPNPTQAQVAVKFQSYKMGKSQIQIINQLGQVCEGKTVETALGENSLSLDLSHLPNGLYLFRLQQGAEAATQKLIIQR